VGEGEPKIAERRGGKKERTPWKAENVGEGKQRPEVLFERENPRETHWRPIGRGS